MKKKKGMIALLWEPGLLRDGYAFHLHVASAGKNRGQGITPEYDPNPGFYLKKKEAYA